MRPPHHRAFRDEISLLLDGCRGMKSSELPDIPFFGSAAADAAFDQGTFAAINAATKAVGSMFGRYEPEPKIAGFGDSTRFGSYFAFAAMKRRHTSGP